MCAFQRDLDEPARACTVCDEFCYAPIDFPLGDLGTTPGVRPSSFVRAFHNYLTAPTGQVHVAHNTTSADFAAAAAVDGAGALSDDEDGDGQAAPPSSSRVSALARSKKYPPGQRWLLGAEVPPLNPTLRAQYNCTQALSPADRDEHKDVCDQLSSLILSPRGIRSAQVPAVDGCGGSEVVASVCDPCHNALSRDQLPTHAIANHNWLGHLPSQFNDTTAGEYSLLRFAYRCGGRLVALDGGRGHTSFEGHMVHAPAA